MNKPIIILGSGGHAAVLIDILREQNRELIGLISPEKPLKKKIFEGIPHYLSDEDVLNFDKNMVHLVNGIGSLPGTNLRKSIFSRFVKLGYQFETVISSNSEVSNYAELGQGVQVMSGAMIQTGTIIGANCIVNTGAIIEHDCILGMNNHIAPGVTLSGDVKSKDNVHFGTGCVVIQSVNLSENVVIGAGAVITMNIRKNTICLPPRTIEKELG